MAKAYTQKRKNGGEIVFCVKKKIVTNEPDFSNAWVVSTQTAFDALIIPSPIFSSKASNEYFANKPLKFRNSIFGSKGRFFRNADYGK